VPTPTVQAEPSLTVATVVPIASRSTARRTTEPDRSRVTFGRQPDARRLIMLSDLFPGLDLRHLAAFSAVAKTGSFARAAEMLGYTQPAVSQQVAALERIVGQRLFERSSGRAQATLTEAGAILAGHVDELTARMAIARQDLLDLARGDAGSIRVGAFQSALARILPHVLQRYQSSHPAVHVEAVESNNDIPLLQQVKQGTLDLAFALLPLDSRTFAYRELVLDEFVLVSKPGGLLPTRIDSHDQLHGLPLIVYRTCRSATALVDFLDSQLGEPNIVFRSDDNAAIEEMVRAGLGLAILPRLWTSLGTNEGVEITPLTGIVPPRVVVLAWRADRTLTPAQQSFVDVAAAMYPRTRAVRLAS
jgi:DNA-binding transcriptional LysR family regulator